MKHFEGLEIFGSKIVLVPYLKEHVPKYHKWMGDSEILRLTGSERLSLQQEYDMQQTWENDQDKCTFIILDKEEYEKSKSGEESMIGDTNLFLNVDQDDNSVAEIEIMIAEVRARRKGFATEALKLVMAFGTDNLGKTKYIAKIKQDNQSSITMFEKLGYKIVSTSNIFQEVTLIKV